MADEKAVGFLGRCYVEGVILAVSEKSGWYSGMIGCGHQTYRFNGRQPYQAGQVVKGEAMFRYDEMVKAVTVDVFAPVA